MTKRIKAPFAKGAYKKAIPAHRRLMQTASEDNLKAWINQCRIEGKSAHKELLDAWLDHEAECRDFGRVMLFELAYYLDRVSQLVQISPEAMLALATKYNRQPFIQGVLIAERKPNAKFTANRTTHPRLCGAVA